MFSYWKYQQLANQIYYILSIINQMGCRHLRNFVGGGGVHVIREGACHLEGLLWTGGWGTVWYEEGS